MTLALITIGSLGGATEVEPAERVGAGAKAKRGRLVVLSSQDGRILKRLKGGQRGDEYGTAVAREALPMADPAQSGAVGAPGADGGAGRFYGIHTDSGRRLWWIGGEDLSGGAVERFGQSMVVLGHINGDSMVHWAVGAPGTGQPGGAPGTVVVLHAPDEQQLVERFRVEGSERSRFGWALWPSDDDGSNFFDHIVVGAPGEANASKETAGAIHRFSALDGTHSWTVVGRKKNQHLGYALSGLADRDGDGVPEILAGAPGGGRTVGRVFVISGRTGEVLKQIEAPAEGDRFGFSVGRVDVDGDSVVDVIVGAPSTDGDAGEETGAVYAYSGVDWSLLWSREGESAGQWFGTSLFVSGQDVDGDGLRELAVGSMMRFADKPKGELVGAVDVVSPARDQVLFSVRGKKRADRLGSTIFGGFSDLDGDGASDLLVGSPRVEDLFIPE